MVMSAMIGRFVRSNGSPAAKALRGARSLSAKAITTEVKNKVTFGPFGAGGLITGSVAKGWEPVRAAFEENFALKQELGAQLAIYRGEELVVDLAGHSSAQPHYTAETLQCVFSSGKNMEAVAIAMLVSRDLISYHDLVSDYWPEFAQNGKESITIADVMRHEAGIPFHLDKDAMADKSKDVMLSRSHLDDIDKLESVIEKAPSLHEFIGSKRSYHAVNRGFIVSGILRRVDPERRTLGQFIHQEISQPLGITYFAGIPESEQGKYVFADMTQIPLVHNVLFEVIPAAMGIGCPALASSIAKLKDTTNPALRLPCDWMGKFPKVTPAFFNTPYGRSVEITSAGMFTNARSMAKVNACMVNAGAFGGTRLMRDSACANSLEDFKSGYDSMFSDDTVLSCGGFGILAGLTEKTAVKEFTTGMSGFVGWGGWGGSLSVFHPDKSIAVSYTMNAMENYLVGGRRPGRIMCAVQSVI